MAIPPQTITNGQSNAALINAVQSIGSDIYGFQEVDHFLPRSGSRPQMRDIAESLGARYWAMAPSVIGTPGESWRKKYSHEPNIITESSPHAELLHECYGIGMVSTIAVQSWHHLHLGRSPIGLPLVIPGGDDGKVRPRFIYVHDEPRIALAAVLENGWTVINTHLSFVPLLNLWQLRKIKKWALELAEHTRTRVIVMGDLNLPKNLPIAFSRWRSLVTANTYPSWGAKIQFDYLLSPDLTASEYQSLPISRTGISDHLPLSVEIFD